MSEEYIVKPVYKALQVLRCLGEERRELALSEICFRVGLPKTTVFRYLHTLCACGFVNHDPKTDLYRIGLRMWELSRLPVEPTKIREMALPYLRELRDQFNETANLGVLDKHEVVYLEIVESRRSLRMLAQLGNRDPAYSTALGKSILAFIVDERLVDHLPASFEPRTPNTLITPGALRENLLQTRQQGYALDDEENEEGARCVGAPIFNRQGEPVAAISLSAPAGRVGIRQVLKIAAALIRAGTAISERLGYNGSPTAIIPPDA